MRFCLALVPDIRLTSRNPLCAPLFRGCFPDTLHSSVLREAAKRQTAVSLEREALCRDGEEASGTTTVPLIWDSCLQLRGTAGEGG